MNMLAKSIVKNKCWVVEKDGSKVATIMALEPRGFVYVHDDQREVFSTIKLISEKYNIVFDRSRLAKSTNISHNVHGYPCSSRPHNEIWDVRRRLPIYSKTLKSKSFYCAGHYLVKYNQQWVKTYCPKIITLKRYEFQGPFKTADEAQQRINQCNS
jgi:hypothetical protein